MPIKLESTSTNRIKVGSNNVRKVMIGTKMLCGTRTKLKVTSTSYIANYSGINTYRFRFIFDTTAPSAFNSTYISISGYVDGWSYSTVGTSLYVDVSYYASGYINLTIFSPPSYQILGTTSISEYVIFSSGGLSGTGIGTVDNPFLIGHPALLNDEIPFDVGYYFSELNYYYTDIHFKLIDNIYGSNLYNGPYFLGYNCHFDGDYHCIYNLDKPLFSLCYGDVSNLYILGYYTSNYYYGDEIVSLISIHEGPERLFRFQNIVICEGVIDRMYGSYPIGSILNVHHSYSQIYVLGCSVNSFEIYGGENVGGLIGGANGAIGIALANCYSTVNMPSEWNYNPGALSGYYSAFNPLEIYNSYYVDEYARNLPPSGQDSTGWVACDQYGSYVDFNSCHKSTSVLKNLGVDLLNQGCSHILSIPGTYVNPGNINHGYPIQSEFLPHISDFF